MAKMLKNEGFYPVFATVDWKKTISENADAFLSQYTAIRRKEKFILGYSYGAMIALLTSTKIRTSGLILCSLSPYFREDITRKRVKFSDLPEEMQDDFYRLSCKNLVKKVKTKHVVMLYGDKESKTLIRRVSETFTQFTLKKKLLLSVKKTEHDISDKRYLHTIDFAAQQLLYL